MDPLDPPPFPSAPADPAPGPAEVVLHYGEIGLKGGNRPPFVRRLADRVRQALAHARVPARVRVEGARLVARPLDARDADAALRACLCVPGVANAGLARPSAPTLEALAAAAVGVLAEAPPGSFKIEARRSDKGLPFTSVDAARFVGAACARASGRPVRLYDPEVVVRLEVGRHQGYVSAATHAGPGGLPVGSTSRLLAFLSGGLDSPVAAWAMVRRGARLTAVHFHNRTLQGSAVREKVEDLCRILAWAAGEVRLLVVPFEACQRAIVAAVPEAWRMLVYRRAMFRIAARLARAQRALGYVTGDSLGQVASQTAENLQTIWAAADRPVYAPLIGSDKREITARARQIGTYEVSIRPHEDCCSFLVARHPALRSTPAQLEALEAPLDWPALMEEAAGGAEAQALVPDGPPPGTPR